MIQINVHCEEKIDELPVKIQTFKNFTTLRIECGLEDKVTLFFETIEQIVVFRDGITKALKE